jgi:predicted metalloprotease
MSLLKRPYQRNKVAKSTGVAVAVNIMILLAFIAWLGIDPRVGKAETLSSSQVQKAGQPLPRRTFTAPKDEIGSFVARVLGSTEEQWKNIFLTAGETYRPPILVLYNNRTPAACGIPESLTGPFYCAPDQKIYLDTSFFRELETLYHGCQGGACQFSDSYVIAHEVGHHVQNLLGLLPKVRQQQKQLDSRSANRLDVRLELQADCLAGLWASRENHHSENLGRTFLSPSYVEAAMQTAAALGNDRLQMLTLGVVMPDTFTHGTSAQRQQWFMTGLKEKEGSIAACNTFRAPQP